MSRGEPEEGVKEWCGYGVAMHHDCYDGDAGNIVSILCLRLAVSTANAAYVRFNRSRTNSRRLTIVSFSAVSVGRSVILDGSRSFTSSMARGGREEHVSFDAIEISLSGTDILLFDEAGFRNCMYPTQYKVLIRRFPFLFVAR